MVSQYQARLYIYRYKGELQLQFLVTVVHRYPLVSYSLRQNILVERHLLISPTRQNGGWVVIELLLTFSVIIIFTFLLASGFRIARFFRAVIFATKTIFFPQHPRSTFRTTVSASFQHGLSETFSYAVHYGVQSDLQQFQYSGPPTVRDPSPKKNYVRLG